MRSEIIGFKKSEHAILRQWQRAIPDKLIYLALRNFSGDLLNQALIQVRAISIVKWGFPHNNELDLFIKVDKKVIVTLFFCPSAESTIYLTKAKSLYLKHFII